MFLSRKNAKTPSETSEVNTIWIPVTLPFWSDDWDPRLCPSAPVQCTKKGMIGIPVTLPFWSEVGTKRRSLLVANVKK